MRYTVLIADDSKLQRVIVKENLKDIYDVAEASGGQECLDLVEHSAGKIDAVLLDIVMPGMDGFEVLGTDGCLDGDAALIGILDGIANQVVEYLTNAEGSSAEGTGYG